MWNRIIIVNGGLYSGLWTNMDKYGGLYPGIWSVICGNWSVGYDKVFSTHQLQGLSKYRKPCVLQLFLFQTLELSWNKNPLFPGQKQPNTPLAFCNNDAQEYWSIRDSSSQRWLHLQHPNGPDSQQIGDNGGKLEPIRPFFFYFFWIYHPVNSNHFGLAYFIPLIYRSQNTTTKTTSNTFENHEQSSHGSPPTLTTPTAKRTCAARKAKLWANRVSCQWIWDASQVWRRCGCGSWWRRLLVIFFSVNVNGIWSWMLKN